MCANYPLFVPHVRVTLRHSVMFRSSLEKEMPMGYFLFADTIVIYGLGCKDTK